MAMPQLKSKQHPVEVFTLQFTVTAILEPIGALTPYLENADRKTFLFKQANVTPIETSLSLPTFTADELWIPRKEIVAMRFLEPSISETVRLLPNKTKLRLFMPHFVVQATFSHGPDTKLNEIFDATSSDWITAADARIYPLLPTRSKIVSEAQSLLVIKHHIQFYQPVKE